MATSPEEWQDSFAECEAIVAIDASRPYVPGMRGATSIWDNPRSLRRNRIVVQLPVDEEREELGGANRTVVVKVPGAR